MVELVKTGIADLVLLKPKVFGDARGHFIETYNLKTLQSLGLNFGFVQDNQSLSRFGTLRGLHFQKGEFAQTKLIRVLQGRILDAIVDLRPQSATFKKTYTVELNDENHLQLLVPKGFAHGFVVLSESALVAYKCDTYYSPQNEGGIDAYDSALNIDWQIPVEQCIRSPKDEVLPSFKTVLEQRSWELR